MALTTNLYEPAAGKPLAKAWLFVLLLSIVGCLNYLDRIMITTMRTSIVEAIPMTDTQFGLLTSSFLWVYGLLSPFGGYLADRLKRSQVVICSLLLWSLVTWLTAHVSSYEELLATRILMGVSEACYMPAALALITDYHKGPTRSLAVGIHMAGVIAGQGLGFIGGWMAETQAWNYAFNFFGITGIIYAVFLALILRDAPDRNIPETNNAVNRANGSPGTGVSLRAAFVNLFSRRPFVLALGFWGLLGIAGWMIVGWLPTYYKEQYHLSQSSAGLYATAYLYAASMVGVVFGGWIADRWSRVNQRARIYVPAIGLLMAAPGILFASATSMLAVTVAGFMLYAFTKAFSDANMMPILCLVADKRYHATGYGILNLFSCIIGGVGLYAVGVLRDAAINLSGMFIVAGIALLVCALLLFLVKPGVQEE